jgi:hypothetical protein
MSVIAIMSTGRGTGRTITAANLAWILPVPIDRGLGYRLASTAGASGGGPGGVLPSSFRHDPRMAVAP